MPELPEVETTCRGIAPHLVNATITKIIIRQHKLRWPIDKQLPSILKQQQITTITRRGKYILIEIATTGTLILHLGMSGRITIVTANTPIQKHDHLDIILDTGKCLRYHDPRRFGCVLFTSSDPLQHKLLAHLGPEPLTKIFTGKYLYNRAKTKKIMIKKFIMDSVVVVGVGNIYASEALFAANIHPTTICNTIDLAQYTLLVKHIKVILKKSIQQGGTTLKDFLNADGKPGYFVQSLSVYGRENAPCNNCQTAISKVIIAGRASFYCGVCQSL